ncbi:hypothetical protein V8E53_013431 [Lactarius tabidus]
MPHEESKGICFVGIYVAPLLRFIFKVDTERRATLLQRLLVSMERPTLAAFIPEDFCASVQIRHCMFLSRSRPSPRSLQMFHKPPAPSSKSCSALALPTLESFQAAQSPRPLPDHRHRTLATIVAPPLLYCFPSTTSAYEFSPAPSSQLPIQALDAATRTHRKAHTSACMWAVGRAPNVALSQRSQGREFSRTIAYMKIPSQPLYVYAYALWDGSLIVLASGPLRVDSLVLGPHDFMYSRPSVTLTQERGRLPTDKESLDDPASGVADAKATKNEWESQTADFVQDHDEALSQAKVASL